MLLPLFNTDPTEAGPSHSVNLLTSFPNFDLETLLQTSPLGLAVLNYYKTYSTLDEKNRNRLVDIIIKHVFQYIIKW